MRVWNFEGKDKEEYFLKFQMGDIGRNNDKELHLIIVKPDGNPAWCGNILKINAYGKLELFPGIDSVAASKAGLKIDLSNHNRIVIDD